ncbi:hypothetical protein ACTRL1_03450 [Neisseria meningitidis]|uniref:hypothetical protein n=1 Tax=Neisseria meningitidis TaxID=487 RepID=UPI0002FDACC9|nr:hypothetical protein [Neisseria meningitidis]
MPSEAQFGVQTALRLKSKKLKATGIYPEKQKTQEFIRKNKKHRNSSGKTTIFPPSFPRKWES